MPCSTDVKMGFAASVIELSGRSVEVNQKEWHVGEESED